MDQWRVGDVVVDFETRQVRRAGAPVALSPKAFQLLAVLAASRPRAVSRQELQDHLWPDTFVVEKNLTNLVGEIRAALGDDPARPHIIRTVARFGYACLDAPPDHDTAADTSIANASTTRTVDTTSLVEPMTRFIGRTREVAELAALLPDSRLLTLTGAGGAGKTRLALALARQVGHRFPDGVWFADLSPLSNPDDLAQAVATTLGVRQPQGSLLDAIATSLSRGRALLLLDNCEHLVAACAPLARHLLSSAPGLSIVATSREALGIGGERVWPVPPLGVPQQDERAAESVAMYDAVQLLLDRARSIDPEFAITAATAPVIAEVCRRLDGLPLAIELAAARLTVLSIDQVRDRLDDRFGLLAGGDRTAGARQYTLEAAIDWSHELLTGREQVLLRRLSIFARDWALEAAEAVCTDESVARRDVLDGLARLVDKSLVLVSRTPDGGRRSRFLETIRYYARARLADSGEAEALADRHLQWCIGLAEPGVGWTEQAWLRRLHDEHDNLAAALDFSLRSGRALHGLRLAVALVPHWTIRGHFDEGQRRLQQFLEAADPPQNLRARALAGVGQLAFFQGDLERARTCLARGADDARHAGDTGTVAMARGLQALACLEAGDPEQGDVLAQEGLAAAEAAGLDWLAGPSLSFLAYRALSDGDPRRATEIMERVARQTSAMGSTWGHAIALNDLALLSVVEGRADDARGFAVEAIRLFNAIGDRWGIGCALGMVAGAEALAGRSRQAARLRGAMEGTLGRVGASVQATFTHLIGTPVFADVQSALGATAYARAMNEGRALSLGDAIADAMRPAPRPARSSDRPVRRHRTGTRRPRR